MDEDLVQILKEKKARSKKIHTKIGKKTSKKIRKKNIKKKETFKKKILKKLFKWASVTGVWIFVLGVFLFFFYCIDLPNVNELDKNLEANSSVRILDSEGNVITNFGSIYTDEVIFSDLPMHLVNAVIATEDRKFFEHKGIDFAGIIRAVYINYKVGTFKQGGSTITQQLAKMLFLNPEKRIKRKVQEIVLARQLEKMFSKQQILAFYLNRAYFGSGQYGIAHASRHYFNKRVPQLNLKESAMLAGLLKAPSKYSPKKNPEVAEERAKLVILNMINAGLLTMEESIENFDEDIVSEIPYNSNLNSQHMYFADWVKDQISEYIGEKEGKVLVKTTMNKNIQDVIEREVFNFVHQYRTNLGESEIAVIAINSNGKVLGMVGGRDYSKSQFNRAVKANRQPGSAFKLFVYLTALERGFSTKDKFNDEPIAVGNWYPDNYMDKYYGIVTMKEAFAKSLNSVAIQVSESVGIRNVIETAKKMGLSTDFDSGDPTIALGSAQTNLLELVNAYSVITNNGKFLIPYGIESIKKENGQVLYDRMSSGVGNVFNEKDVEAMKNMMREVILNGTGKNAYVEGAFDIGGKTGTSQDFRDAWFIGFVDDLTIGVWIGRDNDKPMDKITGGSLPAKLWGKIVSNITYSG
ncbi:transglycosylase domain-containing protein [Pseudomonadota bacterium]